MKNDKKILISWSQNWSIIHELDHVHWSYRVSTLILDIYSLSNTIHTKSRLTFFLSTKEIFKEQAKLLSLLNTTVQQ